MSGISRITSVVETPWINDQLFVQWLVYENSHFRCEFFAALVHAVEYRREESEVRATVDLSEIKRAVP